MNPVIATVTKPSLGRIGELLAAFCESRPEIVRLEVFGSFARGEAEAGSDVDVIATFAAGELPRGLAAFAFYEEIEEALAACLARPVHLVDRGAVEDAALVGNTALAKAIARDGRLVYEAHEPSGRRTGTYR